MVGRVLVHLGAPFDGYAVTGTSPIRACVFPTATGVLGCFSPAIPDQSLSLSNTLDSVSGVLWCPQRGGL